MKPTTFLKNTNQPKVRSALTALLLLITSSAWGQISGGRPYAPRHPDRFCESCEIQLGIGGTYHSWHNTGGVVLPLTLSWNRNRYEFGLFRFASNQVATDAESQGHHLAAPYWGASVSRRWEILKVGPVRTYFGFGLSYKTSEDVLSATNWNFAEQLAFRVDPESVPAIFELSFRHWSNGGVESPNRGQDFAMLMVRFER
jgi:hypothetical protein